MTTRLFSIVSCLLFTINMIGQNDEILYSDIDTNDYAATYLGITTTPYTLPKGAMNYQNLYLGYNGVEYGVSDKFSLSAGLSLFSASDGGGVSYFVFGKYNLYESPSTAISISNLNIIYPRYEGSGIVSVLYSNVAFGNKNDFLTLGAGLGVSLGDTDEPVAIFTAGYHKRFSKSVGLMVDVWLAVIDLDSRGVGIPLPSIGFRFFLKNQITIDLGLPLFGFKIPIKKVEKNSKRRIRD